MNFWVQMHIQTSAWTCISDFMGLVFTFGRCEFPGWECSKGVSYGIAILLPMPGNGGELRKRSLFYSFPCLSFNSCLSSLVSYWENGQEYIWLVNYRPAYCHGWAGLCHFTKKKFPHQTFSPRKKASFQPIAGSSWGGQDGTNPASALEVGLQKRGCSPLQSSAATAHCSCIYLAGRATTGKDIKEDFFDFS